jgi:phosphohistidine phosphatase SixA
MRSRALRSRALGIVLGAGALSLGLLAPTVAVAQQAAAPPLAGADLLAALRAGGHILYFRHADTDHSQVDRGVRLEDCTTQRNLTDRGRDHSRALGEAIRSLDIPIGAVLASPMCRTMETATLAFGTALKSPAVREGGPLAPGTPGRFPALRELLSTKVAPGANTVIVGHAYPYFTLVGGQYLDEGEADVVQPRGTDFEVLARLGLKQWRDLATLPVRQ